jgi:hypothetical protein
MNERRTAAGSLLAAAVLHGALLGVAARLAGTAPPPIATRPPAAPVEIDLVAPAPEPATGAAAGDPQRPSARLARVAPATASRRPRLSTDPVAPPEPGALAEQPGEPPAGEPGEPEAHLSLDQLGVGGANPLLGNGSRAPLSERRAAERRVQNSIEDPLWQRDRKLGLGASGPVLVALEAATHGSAVSAGGRAVFEATADANGRVTGVTLAETNGERAAWQRVAEAAAARLAGKKLRVPRGRSVTMRIELDLEWKLPSGHDPSTQVSVLGVPVKKGEGKRPIHVDFLNIIPRLEKDEPREGEPPTLLPNVRVVWALISLDPDPTDLVPRPRRIVHARVLDERPDRRD